VFSFELKTLAVLEVVHAALKWVRSPLFPVFMQVGSRVGVLWCYTWPAVACHKHWSLLLMAMSWAAVEVPRYLFYAMNLVPSFAGSNMPYPLFWFRYSAFMILYPSGITGELLQMYVSLRTFHSYATAAQRFLFVYPFLYIPGAPFMIFNMWKNRKSAFKKRSSEKSGDAKKRPLEGLVWPITDDVTGERSTSRTNQAIWEASVLNVDPEEAKSIRNERKWRFKYAKHVERQVRAALRSKENAVQIAKDGIKFARESFEFLRDGKSIPFTEAMKTYEGSFDTGFIKGTKARDVTECYIEYKGEKLTGKKLSAQLDKWVKEGTIEPSAGEAIKTVIDNPDWIDLSDKYFVLLGATSAMGPLDLLLACGANIIGIDLDRSFIWENLIKKAKNSPGTLTFPLSKPQHTISTDDDLCSCAGANLLTKTPEIANWLESVHAGKQLTIGNYTYLDGALHVQLSLACDAIMERICEKRKDTAIAFLCTPTDCHNIPADAYEAAKRNYAAAPSWQKFLEKVMGKEDMVKNVAKPVEESGLFLTDGITNRQGPNYALAKRMQHWRCVIAREDGHLVSSNVAPSTSTPSVTSNPLFAAAYEGFVLFKCLEVMEPATSSSAMLSLLINDLRNDKSVANPMVPLDNPMQLFAYSAFHGGTFRCPFKVGTIGTVSFLYFVLKHYGLGIPPIVGAVAYVSKWIFIG